MTVPEDTIDSMPPASPPRPAPRGWRPFIARLHFYAGVLVAPFIVVAALTGGLYAMAPTIERVVYRDVLFVEPSGAPSGVRSGKPLPLREQAAAAQAAFPDLMMSGMRPPANGADTTRIYFVDPGLDEESLRAVFVDPYTGRVLGDAATWFGYLPVSTWLDGLHRHLNLGEPGRIYSELAASWLWVVALGGAYLWLVKAAGERRRGRAARILTVDRSVRGRSRTLNWHGTTGVWLLAALLFLSATGITWSTYAGAHVTDIRAALNWQRPQLDTALTGGEHDGHGGAHGPMAPLDPLHVDYDAVLEAAAATGVQHPVELTLPTEPGQGVGVTELEKPYRLTTNAAAVDPDTLAVSGEVDYWRDYSFVAKLADWGIRAHMGFLFGLVNQLLLAGIAVAVLTVIVRGYRMWWQRRPTRGSAWAVGRAPVRGGVRGLHPAAIAGVAVTAVAVGWFLPLFGLSLAAFVVVDAVVGAVTRRRAAKRLANPLPTEP